MNSSSSNCNYMSTFVGDSTSVMSAVASLLARQQGVKEEVIGLNTSPMLVLTNTPGKDSLQASIVLGPNNASGNNKSLMGADVNSSTESIVPSFEQVHALATANLLASTQRDIAQQLAEANSITTSAKISESKCRKIAHSSRKKGKEKKDPPRQCDEAEIDKGLKDRCTDDKTDTMPHLKALECTFKGCTRKFAWLTHLKYHELTHTNNRQFECPDENCGKTFFTAQRLKVHLRTHTGERPFKCPQADCGKTFTTAGNLKNHERIHTGEQPYVCDYDDCNKRFTEYSSLHKHKLTHSGDKPFKCKMCDKKFTQSGSRRQHLVRHHLDDQIRESLKSKSSISSMEEESCVKRKAGSSGNQVRNAEIVSSMSNGHQIMLLKNAYQGLGEHVVTVATQAPSSHQLLDSSPLSLSQTLLNTDGLHDDPLNGKSDELVVLSENPIFRQEENPADIVYASGILDHEEVAQADYVSSQVEYSEEMNSRTFSQSQHINSDVNFSHQGSVPSSNTYQNHGAYIHGENLEHAGSFVEAKDIPHAYLSAGGEVLNEDFIGAEEVTVSHYHTIPSTEENLVTASQFSGIKEESVSEIDPLMDWDEHLHKP